MDNSFKFRRVNELTGAFVMVTVALLAVGILLAGRAQQWFEPESELRIDFPVEGSFGLQKGAAVTVLGTTVGAVKRIDLVGKNQLQAVLRVRGGSVDFIKTDSVAIIKRKLGVAGDAYIDITAGDNGDPIGREGATVLACRKDAELMEMVQEVLEQVQHSALPVITELEMTLREYRLLAEDIRNPEGNIQQMLAQAKGTLANVDPLLAGFEKGEGTVGMFLKDPSVAGHIEAILDNVKQSSEVLPEAATTIRQELRDVPGVMLQARATLHESERLLEAFQEHWLMRGFMDQYNPLEAIPLDAVQSDSAGEVSP